MSRRRALVLAIAAVWGLLSLGYGAQARTAGQSHAGRTSAAQVRVDAGVSRGYATAVLSGLRFRPARLNYTVIFRAESRPQRAITVNSERTITLYLRPGQSVALSRKVLAYEMGHVLDFWCGTKTTRQAWLRVRHAARGTHWWAPDEKPEWAYGSGDYADVFSVWATGSDLGYVSTVAPLPTAVQLHDLRPAFACSPNATPDYAAP